MRHLLTHALDALPARVDVFIRDDDAGWDDARLLALLDVTQRGAVPIDLAAIPAALNPALVRELQSRLRAAPQLLGVHQHGHTHDNHEREGRKCEFGASRGATAQRADLARGQALLREHFGASLDPIFTPPWNRCSEATPPLLAELGLRALSRNRGARPSQHALQEIAVDVDWTRHWREGGADALAAALAGALRARAGDGQPLGLMLHHAAMNQDELTLLLEVLDACAGQPRLRWRTMRDLLSTTTTTTPPRCTCCA